MYKNKGISLISVTITIIIIIILAAIAIFSGFNSPNQALLSEFTNEIESIKISVAKKRAENLINSDENDGFTKVTINDAPAEFISFSDSGNKEGYVVNFDNIDYKTKARGKGTVTGGAVTFGVDDVYIYDKNGTIFYVKGYLSDNKVYYNAIAKKDI